MQTIPRRFRQMASERPDQALVMTVDGEVSFARMDAASDRVAAALVAAGTRPGDRVALYCVNSASFIEAYIGILKANAVVVPVNLLIGSDEITYILADAGIRGLIYHQAMVEKVALFRDALPDMAFACCIGESPQRDTDLRFSDWLEADAAQPPAVASGKRDLAVILYTSGTTGHPKGAMLTHANLLANTSSVFRALQLEAGRDRLLVVLPMFHAFAATVGMLTPALHGLTLIPVPRFDPSLVSDTIAATGATVFLGVPSMYGVVLRLPDEHTVNWKTIRYGVAGGAAMPLELMRQFEARFEFPVLEGDGPTECSPVTCVNPLQGERKPGSVGLPVPDVEMAIFDDHGQPLPNDSIGEICVRGPNVMKGYWRLPEATAETFFEDWLRTGDLGYRDDDGYIFMVDRKKDLIIVNGMNVYPRMVEEVLYQHPDVQEAAVVGEPHDSHGEIVVAHVVPKEGASLADADIKRYCRERLGQHQLPRKVIVRDSLPKNATGKILKRELRLSGEVERGIDAR